MVGHCAICGDDGPVKRTAVKLKAFGHTYVGRPNHNSKGNHATVWIFAVDNRWTK